MATIAINDTTPELTIEEQFPTEVTPETMSTTPMEQQGMVVTPNLIRAIPHIIVVGESGVGKTHFWLSGNQRENGRYGGRANSL